MRNVLAVGSFRTPRRRPSVLGQARRGHDLGMLEEMPGHDATSGSSLRLTSAQLATMVAHCIRCVPEEGCGLFVGDEHGVVLSVHPTRNEARSAQIYSVDAHDHLRIDREAEDAGLSIIGAFHSHTHTDPWPSPTDVRQAPDPTWHYVVVGLRHETASTRSYRIIDGNIFEEPVVVVDKYNPT